MTTYNNVLAEFENFATQHIQISNFFSGKTWNFQAGDQLFPALVVYPTGTSVAPGLVTYRITVIVCDLLSRSSGNLDEIYSDTMSTMLDMFSYFRDNETEFGFTISDNISTDPFEEKLDSILAGWEATFEVEVEYDGSICNLPLEGTTAIPAFACNNPIVTDVRSGIVYGPTDNYEGSLIVPAVTDVRLGVPVDDSVGTFVCPTGWQRPADWLTLPTVSNGEEKVVCLAAVYDQGNNYVCLTMYCSGAFSINWGDGNIDNYTGAVHCTHHYTYSDFDSSTYCSRGYRQAIIEVDADPGESFTGMQTVHSEIAMNYASNQLLDVHAEGSFTYFKFGSGSNGTALCNLLEQFECHSELTSCNSMFRNGTSLQNIKYINTTNVGDFSYMFASAFMFNQLIEFDISNGTTFYLFLAYAYMYNQPLTVNAPNATNFTYFMRSTKAQREKVIIGPNLATTFADAFTDSSIIDLTIDMSKCTVGTYVFRGSTVALYNHNLTKLDITMPETIQHVIGYYWNLDAVIDMRLRNMTTNQNALTLNWSQLNRDGLVQVLNDLCDRSLTTPGTFNLTSAVYFNDLTPTDLLIATNKNWTILH